MFRLFNDVLLTAKNIIKIPPFQSFLAFILLASCSAVFATEWKNLKPGLEYAVIQPIEELKTGLVHVFRVDLSYYRLKLAFPTKNQIAGNVEQWTKDHQALLGINGGFFDPQFKSLGLRIDDQVIKSPLKPISWWGVFYVDDKTARITSYREYSPQKTVNFAIQAGPRLIINGNIPTLKPGIANRTAMGITRSGKVILLATENLPLSTQELAVLMQRPEALNGLECINAINLDGGTSTQMFAEIDQLKVDISGLKYIADAVLLVAR